MSNTQSIILLLSNPDGRMEDLPDGDTSIKQGIKMKTLILSLLTVSTCYADQFSYQESSLMNTTTTYYTNMDRRIQYNHGDKNYVFLQYRRSGVCPYYCGFNYDMYGLGIGKYFNYKDIKLFAQTGYYIVDNSIGKTKYDENLLYYFNARFGDLTELRHFKSYEVKNDNTFGITIGTDIPLTNNAGIKFNYQYMKIKEVITGYFTDKGANGALWWDPVNRDMSTLSAGFYIDF